MFKKLLITLQDIKAVRPMAEIEGQRWEPYGREAQDLDLRPVLGDGLFMELMDKFDNVNVAYDKYRDLLNGKTYTYAGQTVYFDGVKPMLVYYTLARFVQNNSIHMTRFGVVAKSTSQSDPVDPIAIKHLATELKSNAMTYKLQIDSFLLNNQADYPLYIGPNTSFSTSFKMMKG